VKYEFLTSVDFITVFHRHDHTLIRAAEDNKSAMSNIWSWIAGSTATSQITVEKSISSHSGDAKCTTPPIDVDKITRCILVYGTTQENINKLTCLCRKDYLGKYEHQVMNAHRMHEQQQEQQQKPDIVTELLSQGFESDANYLYYCHTLKLNLAQVSSNYPTATHVVFALNTLKIPDTSKYNNVQVKIAANSSEANDWIAKDKPFKPLSQSVVLCTVVRETPNDEWSIKFVELKVTVATDRGFASAVLNTIAKNK